MPSAETLYERAASENLRKADLTLTKVRCPSWVKTGKAQCEHMFSAIAVALPGLTVDRRQRADIPRTPQRIRHLENSRFDAQCTSGGRGERIKLHVDENFDALLRRQASQVYRYLARTVF